MSEPHMCLSLKDTPRMCLTCRLSATPCCYSKVSRSGRTRRSSSCRRSVALRFLYSSRGHSNISIYSKKRGDVRQSMKVQSGRTVATASDAKGDSRNASNYVRRSHVEPITTSEAAGIGCQQSDVEGEFVCSSIHNRTRKPIRE
jgi:hypothetical protein